MEAAAPTEEDTAALKQLRDRALRDQFVKGARETWVRRDLRRIDLATDGKTFDAMRKDALLLFNDAEPVRRVRIREVQRDPGVPEPIPDEPIPDRALREIAELRKEVAALRAVAAEVEELRDTVKGLMERQYAPPTDVECYSCRGKGHISKFCPQRSQRPPYRGRNYTSAPPRGMAPPSRMTPSGPSYNVPPSLTPAVINNVAPPQGNY